MATAQNLDLNRIVRTIVMHEGRTRDFYQDFGRVMDTLKCNYGEKAITPATRQVVQRMLEEE